MPILVESITPDPMRNVLLTLAVSMTASGVICGGTLIAESINGKLQGKPERATELMMAAIALTHTAVLPLELARNADEQEAAA